VIADGASSGKRGKAMLRHSIVIASLLLSVVCGTSRGAPINVCLSANGGVLESGPVAIRDGDYSNWAAEVSGQTGNIDSIITFGKTDLSHVKYGMSGNCYQYDGGATCYLDVFLKISGGWSSIWSWHGSGWQSINTGWVTDDNGGSGWSEVTGMRLYGSIWGSDTGSAVARQYEMEAWTPEPATLGLVATGMAWLVIRRQRR
jgi:hypothetical protein